jgi:hypothetical protein
VPGPEAYVDNERASIRALALSPHRHRAVRFWPFGRYRREYRGIRSCSKARNAVNWSSEWKQRLGMRV